VGGWKGEFKTRAKHVEALSEGSRTRVRFPPPPPYFASKFWSKRNMPRRSSQRRRAVITIGHFDPLRSRDSAARAMSRLVAPQPSGEGGHARFGLLKERSLHPSTPNEILLRLYSSIRN